MYLYNEPWGHNGVAQRAVLDVEVEGGGQVAEVLGPQGADKINLGVNIID